MNVTLRQLTYFLALSEERHFGRAAEKVFVTQPALSMQIKDLEAALAAPLIVRAPRDIRLTPAGREVEARARRILAEVAQLEAVARQQGLVGHLNIGVIPTVAPYLLPRALPILRQTDITRDLRLREATTDVLLAAMERGQLDAVVIAAPKDAGGLTIAPLFEDRFLLAGRAERLADMRARVEDVRPLTLNPDQLLLLDEGHCLADQALEVCGMDRRHQRVDLGASSLTTLCGLVGQGFGLTFLPELALVQECAAVPDLDRLRFASPEPARQIVLACPDGSGGAWFAELTLILRGCGNELIAAARALSPLEV
ncbi:LysR substrate-binding domain-containing protein [Pseudorhodobacter sp.]|uniref:LysR substrate-binding domain-containing protein n=1 Tax=Pseudorhodobacter sp. TaxID=1934400 RepID=UPI0026483886|nr:LysR substrate-binding domain-containing protein [Pseudorhodobacter sp.]MDN5788255.1 LysR substrate-binding domain-containing protein [Pseudorhodobacter sp.]